jgi:AcrR family transcriptional regulator
VADRGLEAVSIEDITAAADVSPRTFFNYFPTKDDAVLGLDPDESESVATALAARPADETPVQALRAVAVSRAHVMALDADLWTLRMRVVDASPVLLAHLSAAFGRGDQALAAVVADRAGTGAHDLYPLLLAGVGGVAMRTALHRWLATDFTASLPDLVDEAWASLAAGLPSPR